MIRETFKNKVVLVTGGAGFIGSHLVDELIKQKVKEMIIVDSFFLGSNENIKEAVSKGAILYKEDIENKESLNYIFKKHKIDVVFNLATKALNYSFINPSNAFMTNVNGVINLLELLRENKFKTLCHFSTSEVYGTAVYEPMDEKHPKAPTTTYAAGKAAADMAIESYVDMYDLDAFIIRPFNNYGPRQNYEGLLAGVIPITAYRILNSLPPEIHGTGKQSRDFIYVLDTVDAVLKVFTKLPKGESVNISTDNCYSIKNLIEMIAIELEYKGKVLNKKARAADVLNHVASNEKIKKLITYNLTPFNEGLKLTLEWYKNNI